MCSKTAMDIDALEFTDPTSLALHLASLQTGLWVPILCSDQRLTDLASDLYTALETVHRCKPYPNRSFGGSLYFGHHRTSEAFVSSLGAIFPNPSFAGVLIVSHDTCAAMAHEFGPGSPDKEYTLHLNLLRQAGEAIYAAATLQAPQARVVTMHFGHETQRFAVISQHGVASSPDEAS